MPITIGSNPFRDRLGYWMDRVAAGEEVVITCHEKPRIRLAPAGASGGSAVRPRPEPGPPSWSTLTAQPKEPDGDSL